MVENNKIRFQSDWLSKTFAGAVLGLLLAFAISGLFAWIGPGGIDAPNKVQLNMWLVAPIWLLVFSMSYGFRSGARAWAWLGSANCAAWLGVYVARFTLGSA